MTYTKRLSKISKCKAVILLCLICWINGCGFHLRGNGPINTSANVSSAKIYLSSLNDQANIAGHIRRNLQYAGAELVSESEKAEWKLLILSSLLEKKSIGTDQNGRTNEFEIRLNLELSIDSVQDQVNAINDSKTVSKSIIDDMKSIKVSRNVYFDNNDAIGKRNEEKSILQTIHDEVSNRVLQLLSAELVN